MLNAKYKASPCHQILMFSRMKTMKLPSCYFTRSVVEQNIKRGNDCGRGDGCGEKA